MILYIEILFYFSFCGLLFAVLFDKELEESIPIIFILDGIIVSIFTYLNNVYIGIYISIFVLPLILLSIVIFLIIKKKESIKSVYSKLQLRNICIIFVLGYAYLLSKNTYFSNVDEAQFWGPRVFDMLKNNSLTTQNAYFYSSNYKNYPLLFSSIQCLFCFIGGGYREPLLYFANISFCFSLLLYAIPQIKINNRGDLYKFIIILSLMTLSSILTNFPYSKVIQVDMPMATLAAFVFYLAYSSDIHSRKNLSIITIGIIGLLMSKQISLIFVCLITVYLYISNNTVTNYRKKILFLSIIIIILFIVSILALKNVRGLSTFKLMINSYTKGNMWEKGLGDKFITTFFTIPSSFGIKSIPYFYYLLFSCLFFIIINLFNKNKMLKNNSITIAVLMFLGGILWAFAQLYFMYSLIGTEITPITGIHLPSYDRYMNTYLYMVTMLLFMISIKNLSFYPSLLYVLVPISLFLCVNDYSLINIYPLKYPSGFVTKQEILRRINILDSIPDKNKLLIIDQNTKGGGAYDTYINYYLYTYDFTKKITTKHFGRVSDRDEYTHGYELNLSLEEYKSYISDFDYLFIYFADDQYIKKYWKTTTDSELYNNGLYKIINIDEDGIELQFVDFYY